MSKKTFIAAIAITAFLASLVVGIQPVQVANANFFPGDALMINSPSQKVVYTNNSVPLDVVASVANPNPAVVSIIYGLDEYPNVTLTDLNRTLRVPGHIEGSQFYAQLVLENLAEGNHTLKVYSQDASGKQMSASVEFVIDTNYTSPLSVLSPQNITYHTTEIPLTFMCREDKLHDGNFTFAAYVLDGIGSNYIYENSTIADLSIGSHTIVVTVWTENGFFSKTIYFTITNQTPTYIHSPSPSPTQQPTTEPSQTASPEPIIDDPSGAYRLWDLIALIVVICLVAIVYAAMKLRIEKDKFRLFILVFLLL